LEDRAATGHDRFFYRAKATEYPFLRSRNPYGFIKVTVPPGDTLIANPLITQSNTLNALMPNVPEYTALWKWDEPQQTR
jgi:hypothetical protein